MTGRRHAGNVTPGGQVIPSTPRVHPDARATEEGECEGCGNSIIPGDPLYHIHDEEPLQCAGCRCWEERE